MTTSTLKKNSQYKKGNLYPIPCSDLQADPNQPRKYFDKEALEDLANTIKAHGVLQPVLFREEKDGKLTIVAGERRLQAAIKAGLDIIPGLLVEGNSGEISIVENLFREGLTEMEFAEALNLMMVEHKYSQVQLAGVIRKAESTVSEILSLNNLPDQIKKECRSNKAISRQTLLNIVKDKKPKGMETAYRKYKERIAAEKKTRGPKGKTLPERFTSKYCSLETFVTDKNLGKLNTNERTDLISRIEELKKMADALIAQIQAAPVVEIPIATTPASKTAKKGKQPITQTAAKKVVAVKKAVADNKKTKK